VESAGGHAGSVTSVVRSIGIGVLAALLVADLVVIVGLVVGIASSLTGGADDDPHGYVLIFGFVALLFLVPIGVTMLGLLRRLLRKRLRAGETT
jgi:hypothetical protein